MNTIIAKENPKIDNGWKTPQNSPTLIFQPKPTIHDVEITIIGSKGQKEVVAAPFRLYVILESS